MSEKHNNRHVARRLMKDAIGSNFTASAVLQASLDMLTEAILTAPTKEGADALLQACVTGLKERVADYDGELGKTCRTASAVATFKHHGEPQGRA